MIYDPYSREMQHDPYPTYRRFRDEEPDSFAFWSRHSPKSRGAARGRASPGPAPESWGPIADRAV